MELSKALEQLEKLQRTMYAYHHAESILYLDSATCAPRGSAEARSVTLGILSEKSYQVFVNEETKDLLAELASQRAALTPAQARQVELLREELDKLTRIPMEEYVEYSQLTNEAETVWYTAKEKSDYPMFRPYLEKIIAFNRRFAGYKDASKPAYDALLDDFEKDMNMKTLDAFFAALREKIVPLMQQVKDIPISDGFLHGSFPEDKQRELSQELMRIMGLPKEHCALLTSEHPFTLGPNKYDVRITTHYYENMPMSSLYSVLHEGGHALYELGIADEYQYTCLNDASMGMHESQSRFYENIIGRSEGFITFLMPTIKRLFPTQLEGVNPRDLYRAVNRSMPSLIRIEADELTYSLHIMVRYELEKALLEGSLTTHDLPQAWNRLYKEYLGVDVPDDAHGVLQDTHWAGGMLGYFPTYALGSAYGAQILNAMKKDVAVDALVWEGNLAPITAWLRDKIHRHGMMPKPAKLLEMATGEAFDAKYYVEYLAAKMKDVYGL